MGGWRRDMYSDADRAAVGAAVAEHPDGRQRRRLSGHGAVRRHERLGRPRHDAAVRARRRAVGRRRAVRRRDEPARAARRPLPAGRLRADLPQARAASAAAAARFTCSIARAFRAGRNRRRAASRAFRAADPERFRWRDPPYEYEHEKLPFDILAGSSELREQIERGTPAGAIARSWEDAVRRVHARLRERFLMY